MKPHTPDQQLDLLFDGPTDDPAQLVDNDASSPANIISFSDAIKFHAEMQRIEALRSILGENRQEG